MSIRSKITIMFLVVTLVPLLLISGLTYRNYRKSLEAAKLAQLSNIASFKADRIETHFNNLRVYFELSQVAYVIKKGLPVLTRFENEPDNPEFIAVKRMIDQVFEKAPSSMGIFNVMLADPQGKVVYSNNPEYLSREFLNSLPDPQKRSFDEGKNKVYFSDIFLRKANNDLPEMLITGPALDSNGDFIGEIAAEVDLSSIYGAIQDITGLGNTGETLIGKRSGDKILFLSTLRHDPDAALKRTVDIGNKFGQGIQAAAQGKTGSGQFIDYRGKLVLGSWHYMPSLGWGVVAKVDAQEAFTEVENLRNLILFILLVISILSGTMAFAIARSISEPIKNLSRGIEIIGSGDLDYKVGTGSKDEVGQLSRSFDKMALDLKNLAASISNERKRFFDVLEMLPVYVVLLSKDYHVPFANRFFRERFGESGGKRCYEYLFKRSEPCENCETFKVFENNLPHHWEWSGPDGRNYDIFDYPFTDSDGANMIMEMGIDITTQKQVEAELRFHRDNLEALVKERTIQLRKSEEDLKRAQAVAHIGNWRLDVRRNILSWSDEAYLIFRIPKGTLLTYEVFLATIHTDDREFVDKSWKAALTGKRYDIEHRILVENEVRWVREQAELELNKDGTLLSAFGTVQDITERKRIENALAKVHAELEEKVIERTEQLTKANEQLNHEVIERKNIEREVRARNSLLRLAARSNSRRDYLNSVVKLLSGWSGVGRVGIRLLNEDGGIPYESYVGFSREFWEKESQLSVTNDQCACIRVISGKFRPQDLSVLTPGGSFCCGDTSEFLTRISADEKKEFRGECMREGFKSLTIIPIRFKDKIIGAVHFADKRPNLPDPKMIGRLESLVTRVGEDIIKFNLADKILKGEEELVNTQIQLIEAKRLSDIGTLAATVAHELRNPLAAIQMASYNIKRKAQNPLLDKHLLTIENKVNESEQIISNLLFYSRLKVPQYEDVDIYGIMNECVSLVKKRFAKEKISFSVDINAIKNIRMEADPLQIKEVFFNILNNAYEAQTGVEKWVETKARFDNGYINFTIKDGGEGIDKNELERVFDPFFTTKAKGTGLGLTVCKQIASMHGGSIDIESERGKGTTVTVSLPIKKGV